MKIYSFEAKIVDAAETFEHPEPYDVEISLDGNVVFRHPIGYRHSAPTWEDEAISDGFHAFSNKLEKLLR